MENPDYRPSKYHLSNAEIEATGLLAGGAVANICRELLALRAERDALKATVERLSAAPTRDELKEIRRLVLFESRKNNLKSGIAALLSARAQEGSSK